MPAIVIYPAVSDSFGRPRRAPRAAWGLDTSLCRYFVPTAREARIAKLYKPKLEERSVRDGTGSMFSGAEERPAEAQQADGTTAPQGLFFGCALLESYNCNNIATNHYAQVFSRIMDAAGTVATNAYGQHHWKWDGNRSVCANVGGRMYDKVIIDGPDNADLRYEPRECGKGNGDHFLPEFCPGGNRCPLQWQASTLAPNSSFKFWGVAIGFHRFHYWIPANPYIPSGTYHGLYHWTRAEYLVEPTTAFFSKVACGAGGDYGRSLFQYNVCSTKAG